MVVLYRHANPDSCGRETAKFVMSQVFTVDQSGDLEVSVSGNTQGVFIYVVRDTETQDDLMQLKYAFHSESCESLTESCPGAPTQRLKVGGKAYVCTKTDSVHLREGANKSFDILKKLSPGAEVKIIDGPKCANNWSWWKVETESGYIGWMSEGGDNVDKYFLCPEN